ncbi:NACHT domain-containing protein [Kribbella sp. NPDC058245]|uniref:NACHT domain-containing protein n=1 Tax=Kribbella sp. NPDC058245 TaxID=3346399 RepID=UPI0036E5E378
MRIRDSVLRAVVIVLTASSSLVLLPIAINVATGGTAPAFLTPYVGWAWPVIGVLWLILVGTALAEVRSRQQPTISSRSADVPANRLLLLRNVDGYLNQRVAVSLAARTRIALALDERPQAVVRPYDLFVQPIDREPRQLPENAEIAAVFDELQDSMLILGAPGAGKTTLLLSLARTLAEQAAIDERAPIPVLVDLASWTATPSAKRDDHPRDSPLLAGFVRWLLGELRLRYGIPAAVGRSWLLHGRLALLLDGLDEIDRSHHDKLAGVLTELQMHYTIPKLAVTCRAHDYGQLTNKLILNGAVDIRPLTRQQVLEYFEAAGPALDGARAAIEQDDELWDLVTSPLMLNVLLLAYQDRIPEDIAASGTEDVRRDLFDTFIAEVLSRHRPTSRQYDARTAVRSLWCLAWFTRQLAGDRTEIPPFLVPPNIRDRSRPEVDYLAQMACAPAVFAGFTAGSTAATAGQYGVVPGVVVGGLTFLYALWPPVEWWYPVAVSNPAPRRAALLGLAFAAGAVAALLMTAAAIGVVEALPRWTGFGLDLGDLLTGAAIGLIVARGIRLLKVIFGPLRLALAGPGRGWRGGCSVVPCQGSRSPSRWAPTCSQELRKWLRASRSVSCSAERGRSRGGGWRVSCLAVSTTSWCPGPATFPGAVAPSCSTPPTGSCWHGPHPVSTRSSICSSAITWPTATPTSWLPRSITARQPACANTP